MAGNKLCVFAPAKVNLSLHVTGQRSDGYHLLESLVAFADVGDQLTVAPASTTLLRVSGPEALGVPDGSENLVRQVADGLWPEREFALHLTKALPSAAGIGGGSSDAAAMARAGAAMMGQELSAAALLPFGADVPMCYRPRPWQVSGIGEGLQQVDLPQAPAVLVNPRIAVPTGPVFAGLSRKENPPMGAWPAPRTVTDLAQWLLQQRNDLEAPARALAPEIGLALSALSATRGALISRMSGSGATCFALFETSEQARAAAADLRHAHPSWWIHPTELGDQSRVCEPQVIRATT